MNLYKTFLTLTLFFSAKICAFGILVTLEPNEYGIVGPEQTKPYEDPLKYSDLIVILSEETILIQENAFQCFEHLIGIRGKNVRSIQACAFSGCNNLQQASFQKCIYIGKMAYMGCVNMYSVSYAPSANIQDYAFHGCQSLPTHILNVISRNNPAAF